MKLIVEMPDGTMGGFINIVFATDRGLEQGTLIFYGDDLENGTVSLVKDDEDEQK